MSISQSLRMLGQGRNGVLTLTVLGVLVAICQLLAVITWGSSELANQRREIAALESRIVAQAEANKAFQDRISPQQNIPPAAPAEPLPSPKTPPSRPPRNKEQERHAAVAEWWFDARSDSYGHAGPEALSAEASAASAEEAGGGARGAPWPLSGPNFGGTDVTWDGPPGSSIPSSPASCYFGDMMTPAVVSRPKDKAAGVQYVCQSPPQVAVLQAGDSIRALAALHSLTIDQLKSLNPEVRDLNKVFVGQQLRLLPDSLPLRLEAAGLPEPLASRAHTFAYYALKASSVIPHASPIPGNIQVTVHGAGFAAAPQTNGLRCRFGSKVVAARSLSPSALACRAPPMPCEEGCPLGDLLCCRVSLEVSLNGRDFTHSALSFAYFRTPVCIGEGASAFRGDLPAMSIVTLSLPFHGVAAVQQLNAISTWFQLKGHQPILLAGSHPSVERAATDYSIHHLKVGGGGRSWEGEYGRRGLCEARRQQTEARSTNGGSSSDPTEFIALMHPELVLTNDLLLALLQVSRIFGPEVAMVGAGTWISRGSAEAPRLELTPGMQWPKKVREMAGQQGGQDEEGRVQYVLFPARFLDRHCSAEAPVGEGVAGWEELLGLLGEEEEGGGGGGVPIVDASPAVSALLQGSEEGQRARNATVGLLDGRTSQRVGGRVHWAAHPCPLAANLPASWPT